MNAFQWQLAGRCHKFGHDVPHSGSVMPKWLISGRYMDPETLIPHLFEELRPDFHKISRPGDIIVAGRNFGMGPKMNGYIAMHALGMGLLTESMPFLAYRAALSCGLRVLDGCANVLDLVEDGDEIEVNFKTGNFVNYRTGERREFSPFPSVLEPLLEAGGTAGFLRAWHKDNHGTLLSGESATHSASN